MPSWHFQLKLKSSTFQWVVFFWVSWSGVIGFTFLFFHIWYYCKKKKCHQPGNKHINKIFKEVLWQFVGVRRKKNPQVSVTTKKKKLLGLLLCRNSLCGTLVGEMDRLPTIIVQIPWSLHRPTYLSREITLYLFSYVVSFYLSCILMIWSIKWLQV